MKSNSIRLLTLFVCIALLMAPVGVVRAGAETSTDKQQFHVEFPDIDRCSLEPVWVVVDGDLTIHTTQTEKTTHINTHTVWETRVVEIDSGELYTVDHGIEKYNLNLNPNVVTETDQFIASGKHSSGESWHLTLTTHYTLNADGTVAVSFIHGNLRCP